MTKITLFSNEIQARDIDMHGAWNNYNNIAHDMQDNDEWKIANA